MRRSGPSTTEEGEAGPQAPTDSAAPGGRSWAATSGLDLDGVQGELGDDGSLDSSSASARLRILSSSCSRRKAMPRPRRRPTKAPRRCHAWRGLTAPSGRRPLGDQLGLALLQALGGRAGLAAGRRGSGTAPRRRSGRRRAPRWRWGVSCSSTWAWVTGTWTTVPSGWVTGWLMATGFLPAPSGGPWSGPSSAGDLVVEVGNPLLELVELVCSSSDDFWRPSTACCLRLSM